ncbi:transcriptional regulator, AraC family [Neorhodopirellula lusitana]|uniref:Transcriptional regulator, AraC family n=1 Tax=Neorhodopirellula lusitana TaxID=445327 RepID=A0ABY1QFC7_9BACT|nr:AraC family transcriptional regulator [Neorhodopirellula lusitana]SMP69692.1 transcriptional regulator, AraC family [Neorhodopirellula lusitana]
MSLHPEASILFSQLSEPFTGESLFDGLHDTVYFIKNAAGQYVVVNETLVQRCGLKRKSQLIGRTSEEILRPPFGHSFTRQDQALLQSGKPLVGQLELHLYASRDVGWCLTNKYALTGRDGGRIGLVGFSRDLDKHNESTEDYQRLGSAIRFAQESLAHPISVTEMAETAGLSRYQLDRRMRIVFGLNTGQWLLKQRIDRACELLQTTQKSIIDVALETGYADQSAFTRQFGRATGISPSQYRKVELRTQE